MNAQQRTLILLRHAKSDYPPGVADNARPLAKRGIREAGLAGDWLRSHAPCIDQVLCSTATRTRETLERTGISAPVRYLDELYDAMPGSVIATINTVAADINTLLVIGHEPAMSNVALGLAGVRGTDPRVEARVATKFPTSGIAVLLVENTWRRLELSGGSLVGFHVPR